MENLPSGAPSSKISGRQAKNIHTYICKNKPKSSVHIGTILRVIQWKLYCRYESVLQPLPVGVGGEREGENRIPSPNICFKKP
jgi:hypothetical protein